MSEVKIKVGTDANSANREFDNLISGWRSKLKGLVGGAAVVGAGFSAASLVQGSFSRADELEESSAFTAFPGDALALGDTLDTIGEERGTVTSNLEHLFNMQQQHRAGAFAGNEDVYAAYSRTGISPDMDPMKQLEGIMQHVQDQGDSPRAFLMQDLQTLGASEYWKYPRMAGPDETLESRYERYKKELPDDLEDYDAMRRGKMTVEEEKLKAQRIADETVGGTVNMGQKVWNKLDDLYEGDQIIDVPLAAAEGKAGGIVADQMMRRAGKGGSFLGKAARLGGRYGGFAGIALSLGYEIITDDGPKENPASHGALLKGMMDNAIGAHDRSPTEILENIERNTDPNNQ